MTEQDEYDMSRVEMESREFAAGFRAGAEAMKSTVWGVFIEHGKPWTVEEVARAFKVPLDRVVVLAPTPRR